MKALKDYARHICAGFIFGLILVFFGTAMAMTGVGYLILTILGLTSPECDMDDVENWRQGKGKEKHTGPWGS